MSSTTTFKPSEAAEITGVSVELQRDWRRRGFLFSAEGKHARFDVHDLARMLFLKQSSDAAIGPHVAARSADLIADFIAHHCAKEANSYAGNLPKNAFGLIDIDSIARQTMRDVSRTDEAKRILPTRFALIWPTGEPCFHNSVDQAIATNRDGKKMLGPIVVFDLEVMADVLLVKTERPFFVFEDH